MSYLAYLTLPAAFLLFVFALGELAVPRVQRRNVLLALIFGGFALILVRAFFLLSGWILYVPHLYELTLPVNFFLGPLIRAYVRQAAGLPGAARLRLAWHFVPGLIVLVLLIPGFLEPGAQKIERILAFQAYLQSNAPLSDPTMLVFPLGILHAGVYFAWIVREIFVSLSVRSIREESTARALVLVTTLGLASCVIAIVGIVIANSRILEVSLTLLSTIPPILYVMQRRFPQFFNDLEELLERERERARYRRSQLEGVDLAALEARLERLMSRDRIYARDDLNLPALADLLGIGPHQLSEYFNSRRNVNFAGFVNRHRVEAAQALLIDEPERTVLSIAYEVGFNSKSAFNDAFARYTGLSPTRFRKERST